MWFNQRATKILAPLRDTFQLEYRIAWNAEAKKQIRERGETGALAMWGFCGAGWSVFIGEWQVIRWYMSHCEESIRFVFVIAFNCVVFFSFGGVKYWKLRCLHGVEHVYSLSTFTCFFFFSGEVFLHFCWIEVPYIWVKLVITFCSPFQSSWWFCWLVKNRLFFSVQGWFQNPDEQRVTFHSLQKNQKDRWLKCYLIVQIVLEIMNENWMKRWAV